MTASFNVSAKPLPTTSRGSSAGSSNQGTSLYPAHNAQDVGEVVLAETMNEANSLLFRGNYLLIMKSKIASF